jgi:acyl dehydratase
MGKGLYYEQFNVGDSFRSQARTVTETDVVTFAGLSGDFNPLHTDATFAAETPIGERIAHGMLIASIATGMANWTGIFEGTTVALMEQVIRYTGMVKFGDTIYLQLTVSETKPTSKSNRGIVLFETQIINQDGKAVIEGTWTLMMRREELKQEKNL